MRLIMIFMKSKHLAHIAYWTSKLTAKKKIAQTRNINFLFLKHMYIVQRDAQEEIPMST